jgi:16S rRNA (cytidine1402-2'-O)-methyltransferase
MQKKYGRLFLIPNFLADNNPDSFLAEYVREQVHHITHFIVETEKDARALIKRLKIATPQAELKLWLWNEHSDMKNVGEVLHALENGMDAGIITDAGLPCIADPGSDIVALAHQKNIEVIPLPGASSILMALMASGMNGQRFAFHGYLPIDKTARAKKIKELEDESTKLKQTQIFMEAPYRNNQLMEDLLKHLKPHTRLCVAMHISAPDQLIKTYTVQEWKKHTYDLHKKPVIFVLG